MIGKTIKDISASVRDRLLHYSRQEKRPFNELLQYYAMERFLHRLSRSKYSDRFILKGGFLLMAWRFPENRPTMDIDMLGKTSNEESTISAQIREIITTDVEPDGLHFDPDSVRTERIVEHAEYKGVRILMIVMLGLAKIHLQVDIGFNDIIFPAPSIIVLPSFLGFSQTRLQGYSRESVIAEKYEIMVKLGELNSRMKDFYDIWLLSRCFDYDGVILSESIRLTFERRNTQLSRTALAFNEITSTNKNVQWTAFMKRLQHSSVPGSFVDILGAVNRFLFPPTEALSSGIPFTKNWIAPGPWK